MDSQGFVALNFIANFKRIKTLTEDYELLRHVSRQLRSVEHYVGEDGVDRLRPREHWAQWVFPIDQRDPSAQSEGPPPSRVESSPAQNHVEGAVNGVSHQDSLPNGTSKTSLSSTAPEFSPSKPLTPQNEVANVCPIISQLWQRPGTLDFFQYCFIIFTNSLQTGELNIKNGSLLFFAWDVGVRWFSPIDSFRQSADFPMRRSDITYEFRSNLVHEYMLFENEFLRNDFFFTAIDTVFMTYVPYQFLVAIFGSKISTHKCTMSSGV